MIRNWLDIIPADNRSITINEPLSFETEVIRNKIWYRGDAYELEQLYKQIGNAVTVPVVRAIGEKIAEYWKGEKYDSSNFLQ